MEWISVKDDLPECWLQHGDIFASGYLLTWDSGNEFEVDQYSKKGKHTNNGWIKESEGWDSGNEVTHWMLIKSP